MINNTRLYACVWLALLPFAASLAQEESAAESTDALQQQVQMLQRENEALRSAQTQLQSEIDGYLDQLAETEEAYNQAAESARKAQAGIDALKKTLNRIRDERDQLAVELKQTKEAQDRKVQATINALKSTLNRVRNERDELATELGQAKAGQASSADTGKQYYTVKLGDTLTGIAIEFYGNGYLWPKLLEVEANRAVISNPNHLEPGTRLIIPDISE